MAGMFLEFELTEVHIEGLDPIMCGGIKITDKIADTKLTHGGDHNAYGVAMGLRDMDFTLTTPKDHMSLYQAYYACIDEHLSFTILCMGRPTKNSNLVTQHALYDCWFNEASRDIEGMKETVVTVGGSALSGEVVNTEYE